jgi:hypothetical protein
VGLVVLLKLISQNFIEANRLLAHPKRCAAGLGRFCSLRWLDSRGGCPYMGLLASVSQNL